MVVKFIVIIQKNLVLLQPKDYNTTVSEKDTFYIIIQYIIDGRALPENDRI